MKRCTHCNEQKPLELFFVNKARPDGRGSWCKACLKVSNDARYMRMKADRDAVKPPVTIKDRLMSRVTVGGLDDCWIWGGATQKGYGAIGIGRKVFRAHRVSYEIFKGAIPTGIGYHGTSVCHCCDNPLCVNPSHLFIGQHAENMIDKIVKGRQPRGVLVGSAKLDEALVAEIRKDLRPARVIAVECGVSHAAIQKVKNGETWRHV